MDELDQNPKEFERNVGELLELAGLDVHSEQTLGYKKVDLFAVEHRLGTTRRIAVECKCYKRVLSQKELSEIYANYLPLYQSSHIDEVLIVTKNGLAPSAVTMVESTRDLQHLTLAELQNMVMDFRPYMMGLVSQYDEDGLRHYYVPIETHEGEALEPLIIKWLIEEDSRPPALKWMKKEGAKPLAILGSYGMGKTTFARHLSYILATNALQHSDHRIPIYVRLGDISAEQSLDGLLGKMFTSMTVVRNYTFPAFMALNNAGRFVIILDGFDEMKHSLTWDEFKFNFEQINRLVKGQSRVIILGRPTAFLSDEEHKHALHGIRYIHGQEFREPDWPTYGEIYLGAFNRRQIVTFLERYLDYKMPSKATDKNQRHEYERILAQIEQMSGKRLYNIAQRPVQLRMLAEVLPQWRGDIDQLTITILYSVFIDLMIEREQAKLARRHFGVRDRKRFARDIAWWLWTDKSRISLTADKIPDSILQKYMEEEDDIEAVRRDLVGACFLERKLGGSLYFPHRSFQEYLVAEEISKRLIQNEITLEQADATCTEEVSTFLTGIINIKELMRWEKALEQHSGGLSRWMADMWISSDSYDYLFENVKTSDSPWYPLLLCLVVAKQQSGNAEAVLRLIEQKREKSADVHYVALCHLCTIILCALRDRQNVLDPAFRVEQSLLDLCRVSLGETYTRHKREFAEREKRIIELTRRGKQKTPPDARIIRFMSKVIISQSKGVIDLSATYRVLGSILKDYCLIADWITGTTLKMDEGLRLSTLSFPKGGRKWFESVEVFQGTYVPDPELIDDENERISSAHHRREFN
jgi:hypothetical protein